VVKKYLQMMPKIFWKLKSQITQFQPEWSIYIPKHVSLYQSTMDELVTGIKMVDNVDIKRDKYHQF